MLNGLFLDPRIWSIDYISSPFWKPQQHGVNIDLHPNAFNIPKTGVDAKYKFVCTSEIWEIPMQKTLEYLKSRGLKIILVPRELMIGHLGNDERYKYKDQYYFSPDLTLAAGERYANGWRELNQKIPVKTIGYPRFDIYLRKDLWKSKQELLAKHGLEKDKKIIYFCSYPPYHGEIEDGKRILVDAYDDLQNTMGALEQYAIKYQDKVQIVVKIHPMSMKCYLKGIGPGREVSGLMEKYYKHPTKYMKVLGDNRLDSSASREMIMISDLVVGFNSIMMLEAVINDKPVIHTYFEQSQKLKTSIIYRNDMPTINKPVQMEEAINAGLYTDMFILKDKKIVEYALGKVDGNFCQRLCEEIKNICK
jgi:hypothetical protein